MISFLLAFAHIWCFQISFMPDWRTSSISFELILRGIFFLFHICSQHHVTKVAAMDRVIIIAEPYQHWDDGHIIARRDTTNDFFSRCLCHGRFSFFSALFSSLAPLLYFLLFFFFFIGFLSSFHFFSFLLSARVIEEAPLSFMGGTQPERIFDIYENMIVGTLLLQALFLRLCWWMKHVSIFTASLHWHYRLRAHWRASSRIAGTGVHHFLFLLFISTRASGCLAGLSRLILIGIEYI